MSLASNITLLAQAIGADIGDLQAAQGNLANLTTTEKASLVAALNELKAGLSAIETAPGGLVIDDTTASTTKVYSSSKTQAVATAAGTAGAAALIQDTTPAANKVYSSTKTDAVAAAAALALINDAAASATKTYSSNKINSSISTAVSNAITALINGAPTAFDTLKELADYVASDQTAASAMTTAINNRVRYDAAQSLTTGQQLQASTNIGVGDPETNFVTAYTAAKA